ncbi:hypothetical protein HMPREF0044_0342 [Gleimia coleocanis DSM 15436]|uniref:RAMA domain-containing protein n=1 Tax=Gleimia coleocanis DSM 15436 TaxID=525245 RepID=C0VYV2_9ACTO|nr:hypothetical protein [Gleimia coleocanis]EEH64605.1 hypothetical protein HMPREF0044_0342 [Gleimia coleocanis DSM 15436]
MPLFELDGGVLIPAQFGRTVAAGIDQDILGSVRDQVLEIIGRPLFPIVWEDSVNQPRLTALDPSGQVVSVEVLSLLDSATIIECLSRLAETANMGWNELATAYPGGVQSFRFGWAEFRNMMPPSPAPGPRLILVVAQIADAVRPVLDVLATSGVEVHELALREMSNGRRFVEVQAVGPRLYGHNPNLLLQGTGQLNLPGTEVLAEESVEIPEGVAESVPAPLVEPALVEAPKRVEKPVFAQPSVAGVAMVERSSLPKRSSRRLRRSTVLSHTAEVVKPEFLREPTPAAAVPPVVTQESSTSGVQAETLGEDATGLYAIAQIVGSEIELVWKLTERERYFAKLKPEGVIVIDSFTTDDPHWAVRSVGAISDFDGWEVWRLGSDSGPTLREALAEINREIVAASKSQYRGKRARKA